MVLTHHLICVPSCLLANRHQYTMWAPLFLLSCNTCMMGWAFGVRSDPCVCETALESSVHSTGLIARSSCDKALLSDGRF